MLVLKKGEITTQLPPNEIEERLNQNLDRILDRFEVWQKPTHYYGKVEGNNFSIYEKPRGKAIFPYMQGRIINEEPHTKLIFEIGYQDKYIYFFLFSIFAIAIITGLYSFDNFSIINVALFIFLVMGQFITNFYAKEWEFIVFLHNISLIETDKILISKTLM